MTLPPHDRPGSPHASPPRTLHAEMNVTPMLDVLLVLIIAFMTMLSLRRTIEAELPDPKTLAAEGNAVALVLEVGPNGYYALNREVVPASGLGARIESVYAERSDKRIILQGARNAMYHEVIRAMDVARGAGVTVIGVDMRAATTRR